MASWQTAFLPDKFNVSNTSELVTGEIRTFSTEIGVPSVIIGSPKASAAPSTCGMRLIVSPLIFGIVVEVYYPILLSAKAETLEVVVHDGDRDTTTRDGISARP